MLGLLAFILVFGLIVTVHELGHLIFAKRAGIMCPEFAIGMGPKLFSYKKNETLYTIRMLPVGGYVMMAGSGMEENPLKAGMNVNIKKNSNGEVTHILLDDQHQFQQIEQIEVIDSDFDDAMFIDGVNQFTQQQERMHIADQSYFVREGDLIQIAPPSRQFRTKKPWPKFLTLFAGPFFNFLLTLVLCIIIAFMIGSPTNGVKEVAEDSPAMSAGLKAGDKIIQLNDEKVDTFGEIKAYLADNKDKPLIVTVERDNNTEKINLQPKRIETQISKTKKETSYQIGFLPERQFSLTDPFINGFNETMRYATLIFTLLIELFTSIFTGSFSFNMLNGPVGIYKFTDTVAQQGLIPLLNLAAMLSINIGIMNLIPIPALDGGRILFVLYEAIFRRPVNKRVEMIIVGAGVVFMFFVMIMVTWNDISRYFLK
ncbi:RIP metalloprotease RseP [Macrococcoides canis]|uniref:Zinc metalloprotease n=1 Tax=Macrococcoides canis TaxID=1855823 RepID=A0A4R6C6T5_9STAP|nr:RIP metalloprotease RseP [Macrococcus canis]MEE1107403.1 RIP metalloprotease RseP [Macrococcus canis]TDM18019.1 RIP metalloprotease RseP [Macrococcus canis]TDM21900.1 RIP metalloprotease RseP [Macrococcus canis]TDM32629.1 RIP metalloprotease RseP [Macrococcus canis]TDM34573.1 RIP metalloprotease RseP [Macrococcus canis]